MGTDNLHHKRKAKNLDDVKRRKASRSPHDRVLIVCEGEKTEPTYFLEIIDHYEINSANICITGDCGSNPINVVEHALYIYLEDKKNGDIYDRVYCVFDQDSFHLEGESYQRALEMISSAQPKGAFFPINSVPCFEYWLLLHFEYTTRQFSSIGGVSVGEQVLNKLREYWPEYEKNMGGVFNTLRPQLNSAITNAIRSLAEATKNHTDHPSTHVHELVNYLKEIKNTTTIKPVQT